MRERTLGVITAMLAASSLHGAAPAERGRATTVPFSIEEIFGKRAVVGVSLGTFPYRMVVHSNAGFTMQLDHGHAAQAGVLVLRHTGSFGIESRGKLSPLGRDEGILPTLLIGGRTWRDVPVSVFETPGDNATGILGLDWIAKNRVVIDYPARTITIDPSPAAATARDDALRRQGYIILPMSRDSVTGRYYVMATIGSVTRRMTVSTVGAFTLDSDFAKVASVPVGAVTGNYGGPKGATGLIYKFGKPVALSIDDWTPRPITDGIIQDTYAYANKARPSNGGVMSGGDLGADFLIAHDAIVDFGNSRLYVR